MMPEPSTRPICGSPLEALRNAGVPFVGWHYDLARRMGLYWTNFAANGDPNGTDRDGTPLPVWDPCIGEECPAMHLCQEPGMRTDWLTETDRKAFGL